MKALLLIAAIFASASAFSAETPDFLLKYWNHCYEIVDTLFDNYGEGNIPNTGVMTKHQTHYVKIHKVCVDGDMVRTMNRISTCAKWGYKQVSCNGDRSRSADGNCYDRDKRVCVNRVMQYGYASIKSTGRKCASRSSRAAWDWARKPGNDMDNYKDEYPNCSVFETFPRTKRTSFNFDIVKNVGKNSARYDRRYKGELVMNVDVELPMCAGK
jgi:hypothetical protein